MRSQTSGRFAGKLHSRPNPNLLYVLLKCIIGQGKLSKHRKEQKSSAVPFFQGPFPKAISKKHKFFFFPGRLLFSEAKILCRERQLDSKTGTMKIPAQSICDFMQINTVSMQIDKFLSIYVHSRSQSRSRVSRADSKVQGHRAHTSRTTLAVIPNVKATCTFRRRTAQSCLSFACPNLC